MNKQLHTHTHTHTYTHTHTHTIMVATSLQYYNLWSEALGPYGYAWLDSSESYTDIPVIKLEVLKFANGSIHPARRSYHFSSDHHWGMMSLMGNVCSRLFLLNVVHF